MSPDTIIDEFLADARERMAKSVDSIRQEFGSVRTDPNSWRIASTDFVMRSRPSASSSSIISDSLISKTSPLGRPCGDSTSAADGEPGEPADDDVFAGLG